MSQSMVLPQQPCQRQDEPRSVSPVTDRYGGPNDNSMMQGSQYNNHAMMGHHQRPQLNPNQTQHSGYGGFMQP